MAYKGAASGRPDVMTEASNTANSLGSGSTAPARTLTRLTGLPGRPRE
jgi:hypothetical protein